MCACNRKKRTQVVSSVQVAAEAVLVAETERYLASAVNAIGNGNSSPRPTVAK